ncbi:phosphatidylglycerophosphatase A [Thiohalobacter sp. COW1]|uniref:phosphatidylglycerophosphatase A family protein n=1 Tax=Thiohalobacter sp. COW1 TaxID=2795687 RepID=UPI001916960F|nr:phosphatidylglycerophosphatase A [Thiohalobacter sp. COW1]BCO31370.1 phosphatidylglycerophosphatase A [Thiohalobacter sp. COW1]
MKQPTLHWLKDPRHLLALGFGSGLAPVAPGTFGTLAGAILYPLIAGLGLPVYLLVVILAFLLGVWVCGYTARALGVHDHSAVVWDEVVGLWITLAAVAPSWPALLIGFVLFRLFDILKPWPIRWLDRHVQGGLGIMIDDVLAGVFAGLCLWLAAAVGWLPASGNAVGLPIL